MLSTLGFELTDVTVDDFLERFSIVVGLTDPRMVEHTRVCFKFTRLSDPKFLTELALPHYCLFVKYRPSVMAAGVVTLTKLTFNEPVPVRTVSFATQCSRSMLCFNILVFKDRN